MLCKQDPEARSQMIAQKGNDSNWKAWLNKSFSSWFYLIRSVVVVVLEGLRIS